MQIRPGQELGHFAPGLDGSRSLDSWEVAAEPREAITILQEVAEYLRKSDIPVAFPTETVYGLGADATRSASVKGIYAAKGRPSDNPLIVHVSDLTMLRRLLTPSPQSPSVGQPNGIYTQNGTTPPSGESIANSGTANGTTGEDDLIPPIYRPLIERFWPGPLTILMPNPQPSRLAPEVTAGLGTFGVRMPALSLARTLIALTGKPLAAPSANASTRPSPTAARHVADDLAGRIELIVDGGPCGVGVESTVVDGLCDPPVVLRPGGVSLAELRAVPGWEGVRKAYQDQREVGKDAPRAPGMKYKHYSPRARVVLYEASHRHGTGGIEEEDVRAALREGVRGTKSVIGVIRTRKWPAAGGMQCANLRPTTDAIGYEVETSNGGITTSTRSISEGELHLSGETEATVLDLALGNDVRGVAQGLFSALRELDRRGSDVIFVEGVDDGDDIAAAVMNRLRKAASDIRIEA